MTSTSKSFMVANVCEWKKIHRLMTTEKIRTKLHIYIYTRKIANEKHQKTQNVVKLSYTNICCLFQMRMESISWMEV